MLMLDSTILQVFFNLHDFMILSAFMYRYNVGVKVMSLKYSMQGTCTKENSFLRASAHKILKYTNLCHFCGVSHICASDMPYFG